MSIHFIKNASGTEVSFFLDLNSHGFWGKARSLT
jgi:hypothetical protein